MKYINENGRSMVEMLGVLAIIGVLSVGGIAGYSKAMNKYKINKTTDQVSMLVANIRTLFSTQGDYEGLTNAQAIKFGVVPNEMYSSSNSSTDEITNAFSGYVTIISAQARYGDNSDNGAFIIEYGGLSAEACVTIVTGDWGSGQSSGLIGIAAGNGTVSSGGSLGTIGTNLNSAAYVDSGNGSIADGTVIGVPGGTQVSTPISVTNAVQGCSGANTEGSGYAVAWKYY